MTRRGAPLDELYFKWLVKPLDRKWDVSFEESTLLTMFRTPFEVHVSRDMNRMMDGLMLREKFLDRHPVKSSPVEIDGWLALRCSFLEMLIALSEHGAYQTGDMMADWLQTCIRNMGLDRSPSRGQVYRAIQRINRRAYSPDGTGGLFPLSHPVENQTRVELWYQMSAYIIENYDGEGV